MLTRRHMLSLGAGLALLPRISAAAEAQAPDVFYRMPTEDKVLALTFDACEAGKVAHLDHGIADHLVKAQIPFTVFMGGKFARDNADDAKWLAAQDFVEIENHSWSHNNNMPSLSDERVRDEVTKAEAMIRDVTGRQTHLFRFPAGKSDKRTRDLVTGLGYGIVQWRWAVGDPDPHVNAAEIVHRSLHEAEPGDILIYHINQRGWHTAEALPALLDGLTAKGFRFVLLKDYLPIGHVTAEANTTRAI